jgi:hypothetical protein
MSQVTGEGTRLLYLLVDVPMSGAHMAWAVVSQGHGLTRFETTESSARRFERFMEEEARRAGLTLAEIPAIYARQLLAEAVAASRAAGHGLPQHYHTFRDLLPPPPEDEPPPESPVYGEPDADAVRYRPEPLETTLSLLDRDEFAGWQPTLDQVLPLAKEWNEAEGGTLALPPAIIAQRREATMDKLVSLVLGPGGAAGFRRRLEDNAYVLLRGGHAREGRRALTAALALDPPDLSTARAHPLVRSLAARALDEARATLAEQEGSGGVAQLAGLAEAAGLVGMPSGSSQLDDEAGRTSVESGLTTTPSGLILPR